MIVYPLVIIFRPLASISEQDIFAILYIFEKILY